MKNEDEKISTEILSPNPNNTPPVGSNEIHSQTKLNQPISASDPQIIQLHEHEGPIENVYKSLAKVQQPNGDTQIFINTKKALAQKQTTK